MGEERSKAIIKKITAGSREFQVNFSQSNLFNYQLINALLNIRKLKVVNEEIDVCVTYVPIF